MIKRIVKRIKIYFEIRRLEDENQEILFESIWLYKKQRKRVLSREERKTLYDMKMKYVENFEKLSKLHAGDQ